MRNQEILPQKRTTDINDEVISISSIKIGKGANSPISKWCSVLLLIILSLGNNLSYSQQALSTMKSEQKTLKLSIWFTAQEVDKYLSTPAGIDDAINWCKKYGASKVHLEAFGRGLYAKRENLIAARDKFRKEGIEVASGVTTTKFGKVAVNGADGAREWTGSVCYTNKESQAELQRLMEYTASMFDEIVLDDWYFTQCQCDECVRARGDLSWGAYYTRLMTKMSRERVVGPAHAVNPKVKVIIKYPQWYDEFHMRGYDVVGEPPIFDGIWTGTEDRAFDYTKDAQGYEIGYNAYFNMRWQASLGSVGGGWFDTGGTRTLVTTYMEQARHTVLGEGKNMILWSYGGHLGAANKMDALLNEFPALIKLAKIVQGKQIKGVSIVKPGNSEPFNEEWICSFLGELGIPLVPGSVINEDSKASIFTVQAFKDTNLVAKFGRIVNKGTPLLLTDGFAERYAVHIANLNNANVTILPIKGSPKTLLNFTRDQANLYRNKLLAPFGLKFDAPVRVELYLFGDNTFVVENINDTPVDVSLDFQRISAVTKTLTIPENAGNELSKTGNSVKMHIAANSLIVGEYK